MPLEQVIASAVQAGLSAQRIYQDVIGEHGFTGRYHSVHCFVRQLRQTRPVPFGRMVYSIRAQVMGSGNQATEFCAPIRQMAT